MSLHHAALIVMSTPVFKHPGVYPATAHHLPTGGGLGAGDKGT